jgi:hypothetical protein
MTIANEGFDCLRLVSCTHPMTMEDTPRSIARIGTIITLQGPILV